MRVKSLGQKDAHSVYDMFSALVHGCHSFFPTSIFTGIRDTFVLIIPFSGYFYIPCTHGDLLSANVYMCQFADFGSPCRKISSQPD